MVGHDPGSAPVPGWLRLVRRLGARPWVGPAVRRVQPAVDRAVSRLTGGRHTVTEVLFPTLILTTTGRRTGLARERPLARVETRDGWAVVGTNYGGADHPAWTGNLLARPRARVTLDGRTYDVVARPVTDDAERARLWDAFVAIWPPYRTYVERSGREPRMFVLERRP